uniref:Uncharacterized protein n=1 Tax=Salix viminalis TaxID=40686 RepID=A0A6N2LYJ7_SALVM
MGYGPSGAAVMIFFVNGGTTTLIYAARLQGFTSNVLSRNMSISPCLTFFSQFPAPLPNPSDRPVSAELGPNSWLWLGAIISSSFIIFLILISLLTRFYIYPVDHNTIIKYLVPASSAFNMLFVCVAIAIASSAAFLWNKRENAMETTQIRTTEISTPSPASLVYETELESRPRQSFLQVTAAHLGQRPNLENQDTQTLRRPVIVHYSWASIIQLFPDSKSKKQSTCR